MRLLASRLIVAQLLINSKVMMTPIQQESSVTTSPPTRPGLLRSISSGFVNSIRLWPEELVEVLLEGYELNRGYPDCRYFGICHQISLYIEEKCRKIRTPNQIRAKLKELGRQI